MGDRDYRIYFLGRHNGRMDKILYVSNMPSSLDTPEYTQN